MVVGGGGVGPPDPGGDAVAATELEPPGLKKMMLRLWAVGWGWGRWAARCWVARVGDLAQHYL